MCHLSLLSLTLVEVEEAPATRPSDEPMKGCGEDGTALGIIRTTFYGAVILHIAYIATKHGINDP
jgi:hypothetical protein